MQIITTNYNIMRKLIVSCLVMFLCISTYAQKILNDSTPVIGVATSEYDDITIGKNFNSHYDGSSSIMYDDESKSISKGTKLIITGIKKNMNAEYYEIGCKGDLYFIPKSNVSFINNTNYYTEFESLDKTEYERLRDKYILYVQIYHKSVLDKIEDKLNSYAPFGLTMIKSKIFDVSEYTGGTGFEFEAYNPTKKVIKYISLNIIGLNSVGDPVISRGKTIQTVKCIGPIQSHDSGFYSFDYVWLSDLVESYKVSSITVTYMDKSIKTIKNIKSISFPRELYNYIDK